MKITKFRIKNYTSILNSGEVALDSKITTLIGKNESGKTCILKALESFKMDYKYSKNDLCLHSEVAKKLDLKEIKEGDIEILTIWFESEAKDRRKLNEINPQFTKIKNLEVTKYFDNSYRCKSPQISLEDKRSNIKNKLKENLSEIKKIATTFKEKLDNHSVRHPLFNNSKIQYNEIIKDIISFDPETNSKIDNAYTDFKNRLIGLPNCDPPIHNEIQKFIGEIEPYKNKIKEILLKKDEDIIIKVLEILPNFIYFSSVEMLEDRVLISDYLAKKENHKILANMFDLLNIDVEYLKDAPPYERVSEFEAASKKLTKFINEAWTQEEKIVIEIQIDQDAILTSIEDEVIKKHHPPSIRSLGFRWFLSFFIKFISGSKRELKNSIILLDDFGIYLHPAGQRNLLKTLEKIAESTQIVFSTHSPFTIDREKLGRVRIVSREDPKGTLIKEKFYASDYDALELIRACIGMKIGDALFTSKRNLLVEGYSDELILEAMSKLCLKKGMDYIDTSKISIFPVNGANKMPFFAIICEKENLKFLVLLDYDSKGRKVSIELKEKFNIDEDNILMLSKLIETNNELVTENLIDINFYIKVVNVAYGEIFQQKLDKNSIKKEDLEEPNFRGIIKFFKKVKIGGIDKIKVAKKIHDLIAEDKVPSSKTISDFSKLFKIVNERLKIS